MLGLEYTAPFYGQDVLSLPAGTPRQILLNHNHNVALYQDDAVAVLGLNRTEKSYLFDRKLDSMKETAPDESLLDLATAYYQTGFDQFMNHLYKVPGQPLPTP